MPGEAARSWLVHIGNKFGPKASETSTDIIANGLGINKSSMLNSGICDTPTSTTRQIIKAMYTSSELDVKRGTDVTSYQRRLIRGKLQL